VFESKRTDCFVGALDGRVHFFQRSGGVYTPKYEHVSTNVLPFPGQSNRTSSGARRSRFPGGLGLGPASHQAAALAAATLGASALAGASPLGALGSAAGSVVVGLGIDAWGSSSAWGGGGGGGGYLFADAQAAPLVNPYVAHGHHRMAAAPFCGLLHPGDKRFSCLVGTQLGHVEL
jgi:hypothetical protein